MLAQECIDMAMLLESLEAGSSTAGRRTSATMPISSLSRIRAAAGRRRAPTTTSRGCRQACPGHHPECSLAVDLEAGPPGRRQYRDPQACGVGAALRLATRRPGNRIRPAGVLNVVQGWVRKLARPSSPIDVRRISSPGPRRPRPGETAGRNIVPSQRSSGARDPVVFSPTRTWRRPPAGGGPRRCRPNLPRRNQALVEAGASTEFLELFNAHTDAHVLGDSRDPRTTVSPLIHPDHLARVEGFVERACRHGDRVLRGWGDGDRTGSGMSRLDRASGQRLRDRPARGVRPGSDLSDLRRRRGGGGTRQLDGVRSLRDRVHRQ